MTKASKIIIGMGLSFLLIWACWAIFNWWPFSLYKRTSPSVESFTDEFYARYNNRDYSYIYHNLTDQEYRDTHGLDDLYSLLSEVQRGVGNYKEREMYSWRFHWKAKETYFYIEYDVTYERGTTNENFLLKKKNGSWLIASYEFE